MGLRDIAEPQEASGDQVLIRVHAAGLNRADLLQARGLYPPPPPYSPERPGLEFAGEIAEVGPSAKWRVGDRVFGITAGEAQAALLLTRSPLIARIPDNLSFDEAAAIPEAFITAHDAIVTQGGLRPGNMLLVHAVGSGVGLAALQIAKTMGAKVIGTSRTADKLDRCLVYGLDKAIVVGDPASFAEGVLNFTDSVGADVILDLVGGEYLAENLASLSLKGRLMIVGLTSGSRANIDLSLVLRKRARIIGTVLRARTDEEKAEATENFVRDVVPHLKTGAIRPNIDRVFPAADAAEAYRYLASNASFGKVLLRF